LRSASRGPNEAALKFAKKGKHESDSEFSKDNGWTIMLARYKSCDDKGGVQMVGVYKDLIVRVQTNQRGRSPTGRMAVPVSRPEHSHPDSMVRASQRITR
jgi:hypothetical protein